MLVFYSKKYSLFAESIINKGLNLISSPNLMKSDIKYICTLISEEINLEENL